MNSRGRPKNKNLANQQLLVRFTKEQYTKLREFAKREDVSITSIVRSAVTKYLEGRTI
jgi:hypothetical protein